MNLETAAAQVAGNMTQDEYKFDPAIIILIIGIISELLPMLEGFCRKSPEETVEMAKNPTALQYTVAAWKARRVLGRRVYRDTGQDVVEALFKTGAECSVEDMTSLYNAE